MSDEKSLFEGSYYKGQEISTDDEENISTYRVVVLGDCCVGKTALCIQFTSNEYINTYDANLGKCTLARRTML